MLPLFGGKQVAKSKFAKLGMATASMLAVSTCMLAIFGETNPMPETQVMEDLIFDNGNENNSGTHKYSSRRLL